MRFRLRVLVALGAAASALPAPGGAGAAPPSPSGESSSALSEARLISAALDSIRGLVAEFSQTVESAVLPSAQVEQGTVFLQRPGRMRFEYSAPAGKLAIADGSRTWLYLPDDRQVLVAPAGPRAEGSGMGILLQDKIDLARQFTASWEQSATAGEAPWLALTPRSSRAAYTRLLVHADDDHLIRELQALDALGGRVTYRFSRIRRVDRLDPELFRFVPPRGVPIQEASP